MAWFAAVYSANAQGGSCGFFSNTLGVTIAAPQALATLNGLSCTNQSLLFVGTGGRRFYWSGPNGFVFHRDSFVLNQLQVAQGGVYQLIVEDEIGCRDTTSVNLQIGRSPKEAAAIGGQLDCSNPCINLSVVNSPLTSIYNWTGPNGFEDTLANPSICMEGIYYLTVSDAETGCFTVDTAVVTRNEASFNLACSTTSVINCLSDSVKLSVQPGLRDFKVDITGPNGFTAINSDCMVTEPGIYTAVVTNRQNGCVSACAMHVVMDKESPIAEVFTDKLRCTKNSAQLVCNASQPGVQYFWTGPGGFVSRQQNPMVYQQGIYEVKVMNPSNGCVADGLNVLVEIE